MTFQAAVITVSDKGFLGERVDTSGPNLCALLEKRGYTVCHTALVPDEAEAIRREVLYAANECGASLILTTGGTGFSPRDITPEAVLPLFERQAPGIPELMRAASVQITPRGCLSRSVAGIYHRSLIITLPGSKKAAEENILAVLDPIAHGLETLAGEGSANCAEPSVQSPEPLPSIETWLREAKASPDGAKCGMYLFHNGVVRATPKRLVRGGEQTDRVVKAVQFSFDPEKAKQAAARARQMPGIYHVRVWLNRGTVRVGDDLMLVLVGGDIRPHVIDALQTLVAELKTVCVCEQELYED